MFVVYFDEAGTGKIEEEPFVVVAGVVVEPDREFKALENDLKEIVRYYIPEEDREGFVFHTTDLFGGRKYWRDRDRWPKPLRWEILDRLTALIEKYDLPVPYGFVDKQLYVDRAREVLGDIGLNDGMRMAHAAAFSTAAMGVQRLLDRHAKDKNAVAMFVAENLPEMRTFLKRVQYLFKDPEQEVFKIPDGEGLRVPLTRVVDTLHFAEKTENSLLQLADVCAFCLKRYIMKRPDSERFIRPILPRTFFMMSDAKLKQFIDGFIAHQAEQAKSEQPVPGVPEPQASGAIAAPRPAGSGETSE